MRSPLIGEIFLDANAVPATTRARLRDQLNRREKFRMKPHAACRMPRGAATCVSRCTHAVANEQTRDARTG
ncbi:MAG: hypothetical protein JF591_12185 [Lysobacter sp.]|nr:hypothetical protein [Lysobacter sp.]